MWTGLSLVREPRRGAWLSAVREPAKLSTPGLRAFDAREPFPGARRATVSRVVQWMAETEKAVLVYEFESQAQFWLPRWLWPRGACVEMAGEAGPVELPKYVVGRLAL